ncbi:ExsB family transcriptional regulator [Candidatus Falkowbacteria bacterium]|nr:MAG: ExsB family transcriptional regulator [Candidatus Falkowbacteria bacterium]
MMKEIKANELKANEFINEQVAEIKDQVGSGLAINALSGGVDSSVVTMLGYRALGDKLLTCFIDNGLMREKESEEVVATFRELGVAVKLIDAQKEFFAALEDVFDPQEKREAITQTFYKKVFGRLVQDSGAKHLLQGTILTDIDETVAGIKRQHNVFAQLGIDPEEAFGYEIIEPLVSLRKDGVRLVAEALGLPEAIYNRQPFPGPALATRVTGSVTREKIELIRKATAITEAALEPFDYFQSMTILHQDRVTGIVNNERRFGHVIQIRCWDSIDARTATPKKLPLEVLFELGRRIPAEIPGVMQVTYNLTAKPPVTMEAI